MGVASAVSDPYGNGALLVDELIGEAYKKVALVADNLVAILAVQEGADTLLEAAALITETSDTVNAAAAIIDASITATALSATNAMNSATGAGTYAANALASATAADASAVASSASAAASLASANNAAASALYVVNAIGGNFLEKTGGVVTGNVDVTGYITVSDDAYGAGWNGSSRVPTKNAVYDKINSIELLIGAANGLATLGADGKLLMSVIPVALVGGLNYQGTWNATTNIPAIPAAAAGNKGWYYVVSTAGATNINGQSDWEIGDWITSNGATWSKIDNSDKVSSVAGRTGAVVLTKADVGLNNVDNTTDALKPVSGPQQAALDLKAPLAPREQAAAANAIVPTFLNDIITRVLDGPANIGAITGTVIDGHGIVLRLKDDGIVRAIAWNAQYNPINGVVLPLATVAGKYVYIGGIYNADSGKIDVLYVGQEG